LTFSKGSELRIFEGVSIGVSKNLRKMITKKFSIQSHPFLTDADAESKVLVLSPFVPFR